MKLNAFLASVVSAAALMLTAYGAGAADISNPDEGDFVLNDFEFHDGTTMDLNVHYYTVGDPANEAVVLLHGTTGTGKSMLSPNFTDALYGPGQPLDADKYYLIFPDAIGTGGTTKPSDGLRASFPHYNLDDMVDAQYRLLVEGLGLSHVRLILGYSMGGMNVWTWGIRYPEFSDALIPMASLPAPMAGRNWMMRRMIIDSVRTDPAWNNGNYTEQPPNLRIASVWYGLATFGGDQALWAKAPTNAEASAFVDDKLANATVGDANDTLYQWDASRDFDPSPDLEKITAHVLVINSDDDERNPLSLGILEEAMPRIAHGQVYIIPGGPETSGHGTPAQAALYADRVAEFLAGIPAN
jgi:homoserine O-acetyltransferase/O-succinyltransferase